MNKVINHHGVNNLENKSKKLKVNYTNKNDIIRLIGPPSTSSAFNEDILIYLERKTSSSKLLRLGKKELLINNILFLEFDKKGMLIAKKIYTKEDMNDLNFEESFTVAEFSNKSFIYQFLLTLRQKIDDPLGKKRSKVNQQ